MPMVLLLPQPQPLLLPPLPHLLLHVPKTTQSS
jgi:hypothetical protein